MAANRRAVIDVGTNSVKLLVADLAGPDVRPISEESCQTRLGQGFYETHRLLPLAIANTAQAVADFAIKARSLRAADIRVIATSAARDAVNANELETAIQEACGLNLEIISGEQEAEWAFQGVSSDPSLRDHPLLLIDIGGGSTEFILGRGGQSFFQRSFRLGSVRLLHQIPHGDPPCPEELERTREHIGKFLTSEVVPSLSPLLDQERAGVSAEGSLILVGTGGTATILARMEGQLKSFDRAAIDGARIDRVRVGWHVEHLWSLSLARREEIVGLPRNRADVILPGVVILETIMLQFGFRSMRVSARGLRYAALAAPGT